MQRILAVSLLLINVVGCASGTSPIELSHDGPTMKQNYENHMTGATTGVASKTMTSSNVLPSGFIKRELESDINVDGVSSTVRRIQNPELKMFVYPHRSTTQGVVVPGYSVNFPMYQTVHYGLVGELVHE